MSRFGTGSLKYDAIEARYGNTDHDVLPMWVADMDFPPPQQVTNQCQQFLGSHYGYQTGTLNEAVSSWHGERGEQVHTRHIVSVSSTMMGIQAAIHTLTKAGDKIAVFTPVYGPFVSVIKQNARHACCLPLVEQQGRWTYSFSDLPDDIAMVLHCNPQNPTGTLWQEEELTALAQQCCDRNIPLVVDEVHRAFVWDNKLFNSAFSVPASIRNTVIVVQSANKTYNLAHLPSASYLICQNEHYLQVLSDYIDANHWFAGALAIHSLKVAYSLPDQQWLSEVMATIEHNRQWCIDALRGSDLMPVVPEATFFLWLNLQTAFPEVTDVTRQLFQRTGIAANDGAAFGLPGWVRVNIATDFAQVKSAVTRLKALL